MSAPLLVPSQLVSAKTVAASCNDVSRKTIWIWRHDPKINFPKPRVINGRLYFDLAEIEAWKKSFIDGGGSCGALEMDARKNGPAL